jgi:hypothetical protein
MAGTPLRRWTRLAVVLVALLESYGKNPDKWVTYRSGSNLWQCLTCKRVERFLEEGWPKCAGTQENPHTVERARRGRKSERLVESGGPRQFFK